VILIFFVVILQLLLVTIGAGGCLALVLLQFIVLTFQAIVLTFLSLQSIVLTFQLLQPIVLIFLVLVLHLAVDCAVLKSSTAAAGCVAPWWAAPPC
jgi:hypothetical protein